VEWNFFSIVQQPSVGQGLLIFEAPRSHLDTPHSVGRLWTSDRPDPTQILLPNNTRHSEEIEIHDPGGIRTGNPSKRLYADRRLRPCGHSVWRCGRI